MKDNEPLFDDNIILRAFAKREGETFDTEAIRKRDLSIQFFRDIEEGKRAATFTMIHLATTLYTLEGYYKMSRDQATKLLMFILNMENIKIDNKKLALRTLELHRARHIDFDDAYAMVYAKETGINEIISFDYKDFDNIPDLKRSDP